MKSAFKGLLFFGEQHPFYDHWAWSFNDLQTCRETWRAVVYAVVYALVYALHAVSHSLYGVRFFGRKTPSRSSKHYTVYQTLKKPNNDFIDVKAVQLHTMELIVFNEHCSYYELHSAIIQGSPECDSCLEIKIQTLTRALSLEQAKSVILIIKRNEIIYVYSGII